MNILDDIAPWLASTSTGLSGTIGPGVSTAYPVYRAKQPASTGNMYVIYQYGGMAPDTVYGATVDYPRMQVKTITAASSDAGYNAALLAQNRLRFVANRHLPTSTGNLYWMIRPLQSPEPMGEDENGRMVWVQNFQVTVTYT